MSGGTIFFPHFILLFLPKVYIYIIGCGDFPFTEELLLLVWGECSLSGAFATSYHLSVISLNRSIEVHTTPLDATSLCTNLLMLLVKTQGRFDFCCALIMSLSTLLFKTAFWKNQCFSNSSCE